MVGNEVPIEKAQKYAKTVFINLMPFSLMTSTTEEKQKALLIISEQRNILAELFNTVCPGWDKVDL